MTYSEAIKWIDELKPVGIQLGLARMETAMAALGHPERGIRAVHIAGTNGKGSTARMLQAMLSAGGYRCALYASPAVTGIRDTITIDGIPISEEDFAACAERVKSAVPDGLSEFEFVTALTFCYFEKQKPDIAVIECGLGGETDATNVIGTPLCAVFTPISLDHTALLGDTVAQIAAQKCGIAKGNCTVVCAPSMDEHALAVLFGHAAQHGQTVVYPSPASVAVDPKTQGCSFCYQDTRFSLSLLGKHQADNAVTALTALNALRPHGFSVSLPVAAKALASITMPCRLEVLQRDPLILLDGAHNPQGIDALAQVLTSLHVSRATLILGMLRDKAQQACLLRLAPYCKHLICCTPQGTPRAAEGAELAEIAKPLYSAVSVIPDPLNAFETARQLAGDDPIIVAGSFYVAAPVRNAIRVGRF